MSSSAAAQPSPTSSSTSSAQPPGSHRPAHHELRCAACLTPSVDASAEWFIDDRTFDMMLCRGCALRLLMFAHSLGGDMPRILYDLPVDPDVDDAEHHWTCRCIECVDLADAIDDHLFDRHREERAS